MKEDKRINNVYNLKYPVKMKHKAREKKNWEFAFS